jgi:hypothetical protein
MPKRGVMPASVLQASVLPAMVIALTLTAALWPAPAAMAHMSFDGKWSVLIVTDDGNCDRAYRYALKIVNGSVTYDDPSFDISGHVDARGRVRVSVGAGGEHAIGTGELSGDSGGGLWTGHSSTSACSGHWEAERRG